MPRVRDWFDDFARTLIARSNRSDWPPFDTEAGMAFWDDFETALRRSGAEADQADEASSIACDVPNLFPNQYRPMVIEAIKKLRARQAAPEGTTSVEAAKLASADCPDCGGDGWARRFSHGDDACRYPAGQSFALPCSCPLGVSHAAGLQKPGLPRPLRVDERPALRLRFVVWRTDMPAGLDCQYRYRPHEWDDEAGRPVVPEHPTPTPEAMRSLMAALKAPGMPSRASVERRRSDLSRTLDEPASEPPGAIPARPDISPAVADPVVARELAPRTPPPAIPRPQPASPGPDEGMPSDWF